MPEPVTAIIASSVIGAGNSIVGGKAQADAAKSGTAAQVALGREQLALEKEIFDTTREDQAPWREAGETALNDIMAGIEDGSFSMEGFDFQADPGYQFRMEEGIKGLDRSAAASGGLLSGAHMKNALAYGQRLGSEEYSRAYAREAGEKATNYNILASTAGIGQTAVAQTQQAGQAYAQQAGQTSAGIGNAIATGAYNQGQAYSNMYGNVAGAANQGIENYLLHSYLG